MFLAPRLVLSTLVFASLSTAQDVRTATLVGTVTDPTGIAIPAANVTATAVETKVVSRGQTTAEGNYYVPFLGIGTYEVAVEAAGFKKFVRTGVILQAGVTTRIDAQLEVGSLTQQVEVTAASPLLATDSAVVGGIDNAKRSMRRPCCNPSRSISSITWRARRDRTTAPITCWASLPH